MNRDPALWFAVGAALGSVATYYLATSDKRAVATVRTRFMSTVHPLDDAAYRRSQDPDVVPDHRILRTLGWCRSNAKRLKLDPERLAAEVIACELLGRDPNDAPQALRRATTRPGREGK